MHEGLLFLAIHLSGALTTPFLVSKILQRSEQQLLLNQQRLPIREHCEEASTFIVEPLDWSVVDVPAGEWVAMMSFIAALSGTLPIA